MSDPLTYKIKKKFDRYVHDPVLALIILPFLLIIYFLPFKISSFFCGYLFKFIAPITKYQKRVLENLKIAFPEKKYSEHLKICKKQWFNFGQIIGEFPHINKILNSDKFEVVGIEKIKKGPAILVGAHLGNWEFLLRVAELAERRAAYVFRPINNWILYKIQMRRFASINADFYKKGRLAAIGMSKKLKNNEVIGLTNDQLLREGIMVPFFGKQTPTPKAAASLCIKWNVPIYMVRVERLNKINFKMTIENKLKIPKFKNQEKNIYEITRLISKRTEEWITERPEQWLWAHRRWGK